MNKQNMILEKKIKRTQRELTFYFLVTLLISWAVSLPAVILSVRGNPDFNFLVKVNTYVPSLVAIFFVLRFSGKSETINALKKIVRVRFNYKWYLFIFLLVPSLLLAAYFISQLFFETAFQSVLFPIIKEQPLSIVLVFVYLMFLEGPFGEEFGWRGFALNKMLGILNPIKASLILGFIWTIWHLPSFFITGTIQNDLAKNGLLIAFLIYLIYTLSLSLFITIVFIKTNRSVFAAILFHTVANFSHGLITIISEPISAMIFIILLVVSVCLFVWIQRKTFFPKSLSGP